jgi:hypothetical protein
MDSEILERLMMDDALGVLSPDESVLLRAYVSIAGDDAEQAIWSKLTAAAKDALTDNMIAQAPSIGPLRAAWLSHLTRMTLAAAAVLIVGVMLGLSLPLMTARRTPPIAPIAQATIPLEAQQPKTTAPSDDFWSSQHLLAAALAAPRPPSPPPQWNGLFSESLFNQPINGETR